MKKLIAAIMFMASVLSTHAVIIQVDLQGQAGNGLLSGNETGTVTGTPGSGGEIGAGITFDDVTKSLTINVGWGSGNGFTDLTGAATAAHVHGFTASNSPASFTQNASAIITLTLANSTASAGFISSSYTLTAGQETALYNGQLYINIHTSTNGGGEIRGQLIAVPEPSTYAALAGLAGLGYAFLRRRPRLA